MSFCREAALNGRKLKVTSKLTSVGANSSKNFDLIDGILGCCSCLQQ